MLGFLENEIMTVKTIRDLPPTINLRNVRFRYPGDGQLYYWVSQWARGVWGRKELTDGRIYPLGVESLEETLDWEVAE